jgi:hypothetical protein
VNKEQFKNELNRRKALILTEIQPSLLYALALNTPIEPGKNMEKDLLLVRDLINDNY